MLAGEVAQLLAEAASRTVSRLDLDIERVERVRELGELLVLLSLGLHGQLRHVEHDEGRFDDVPHLQTQMFKSGKVKTNGCCRVAIDSARANARAAAKPSGSNTGVWCLVVTPKVMGSGNRLHVSPKPDRMIGSNAQSWVASGVLK